jgi:hypothetical protein
MLGIDMSKYAQYYAHKHVTRNEHDAFLLIHSDYLKSSDYLCNASQSTSNSNAGWRLL